MNKTDIFFVIHNWNMVPYEILSYCDNYMIYDASEDLSILNEMDKKGITYKHIENTGHNITTYFRYFDEYYDNLPDWMCLAKGHMIGRHCSKEFFERVINNKYFSYLYEDKNVPLTKGVNDLVQENMYLEINNSWYVDSPNHPHKYFDNYNRLLQFVYHEPRITDYCLFAPGACYIVSKEQVLKHSRQFYRNLNKIMSYGLNPSFPSEAHQIERMLPTIFTANYKVNDWMNDEGEFDRLIELEAEKTRNNDIMKAKDKSFIHKLRNVIGI